MSGRYSSRWRVGRAFCAAQSSAKRDLREVNVNNKGRKLSRRVSYRHKKRSEARRRQASQIGRYGRRITQFHNWVGHSTLALSDMDTDTMWAPAWSADRIKTHTITRMWPNKAQAYSLRFPDPPRNKNQRWPRRCTLRLLLPTTTPLRHTPLPNNVDTASATNAVPLSSRLCAFACVVDA